jgi:hypothetical protein
MALSDHLINVDKEVRTAFEALCFVRVKEARSREP